MKQLQSLLSFVALLAVCIPAVVLAPSPASAQSPIDVVRASNLYVEALNQYKAGRYSAAYSTLLESEKNLKGKTNSDLVVLKIHTLYKLENYSEAYELIVEYFEAPPWKGNHQHYRNIETWAEQRAQTYDESLTALFVKLEKTAGVQKKADPSNSGGSIGQQVRQHLNKVNSLELRSASSTFQKRWSSSASGNSGTWKIEVFTGVEASVRALSAERRAIHLAMKHTLSPMTGKCSTIYRRGKVLGQGEKGQSTLALNLLVQVRSDRVEVQVVRGATNTKGTSGLCDEALDWYFSKDRTAARSVSAWVDGKVKEAAREHLDEYARQIEKSLGRTFRLSEAQRLAAAKDPKAFKRALFKEIGK
jgi:hypothetical protein